MLLKWAQENRSSFKLDAHVKGAFRYTKWNREYNPDH